MRYCLIFLFFLGLNANAQQMKLKYEKTEEDIANVKKFRNNFFRQSGWSVFSEVINDGPHRRLQQEGFGSEPDTYGTESDILWSLATYSYEFRYNVYNYHDNFSISVATPLALGLYLDLAGDAKEKSGLGFTTPLSVDANFKLHSTFNNINKVGFYAGVGVQKIWLLPKSKYPVQAFVRAGFKYPYRGRHAFLEVRVGRGGSSEPSTFADANSSFLKITLGRLLKM